MEPREFSTEDARGIGERIGIDWASSRFDVEQFRMGLGVELEHGRRDLATNVSDDDEITTGKIARAHLNEFPDYYTRLAKMEAEAEQYWAEHGHESHMTKLARCTKGTDHGRSGLRSEGERRSRTPPPSMRRSVR
jgi:Protein of unknown function (DUF5661)